MGRIEIVECDPDWPKQFDRASARLRSALAKQPVIDQIMARAYAWKRE